MEDMISTFTRKYRPKNYSEIVGNRKMIETILRISSNENKPQVVLFIGRAGSGKTTNARLMAKEYRCTNRDKEKGACGECPSCKELDYFIETGDAQDLMYVREIDASESGGKQGIETILEDASISAFDQSWKIYIIDECHTLTTTAQNRLLKNLEEPAKNVLIILATTDPQKLLKPILSRCQYKFEVEKPTRNDLGQLLIRVCENEGFEYDMRGISSICVNADFEPRSALHKLQSVYDQKGNAKFEAVKDVLSIKSDEYLYKFIEFLTQKEIDTLEYIKFLSKMKETTKLDEFMKDIINFTKRGIYVINGARVEALDKDEIKQYSKLFSKFTHGEILYILNLLVDIQKNSNRSDIEGNLMLLGYQGIPKDMSIKEETDMEEDVSLDLKRNKIVKPDSRKNMQKENTPMTMLKESSITPTQEKEQGYLEYLRKLQPTSENVREIILGVSEEQTPEDIAERFRGEMVTDKIQKSGEDNSSKEKSSIQRIVEENKNPVKKEEKTTSPLDIFGIAEKFGGDVIKVDKPNNKDN